MKYYLAIDLGASSGRHIVGRKKGGEIILDEIYRFKTGMEESKDGLVWNIPRLLDEIKIGIGLAFKKYHNNIVSLSIDTWGVDYVLMNGDKEIPPYYAYRNERNVISAQKVHNIVPFEVLYKRTGIQFAAFNTLYQLFDDKEKGRLENATGYLMLPSYFIYKLTGVKTHEFTNETTGALINAETKEYDSELLDKLGLPNRLFGDINQPGYVVGDLLPSIQKEVGGNTKVILCASHDTASAFEAVDVDEDGIILSSGTWSLLGIKSPKPVITEKSFKANYTNEGGVGYVRFLKNIMGMWVPNRVREELDYSLAVVSKEIQGVDYSYTFDINDERLVSPTSMVDVLKDLLKDHPPKNDIELFASIYHSLALGYQKAIKELEMITGKQYKSITIIGGGARNLYLNELIVKYTKLNVIPLPIEATALGNIKIQMKVSKEL